jgi:hypothetical protein
MLTSNYDRVQQYLRSGVRADDRRGEHPSDGACWGGAGSDKRGVDSLEYPEPTLRRGGGRSSATEGAVTPSKDLPRWRPLLSRVNEPWRGAGSIVVLGLRP